ncbi:MAG: LysM peptidoglycan-binding domain-containing protein [Desulfotignum sp.]|nr:LysM peptidoglycan-binding domain-containing protein [Desulfotignum sp.]MCF8113875.1 LysM peptidoglycan-binding domain-containing protein [Desulfotignum sp.]MCF8126259.1 LysM peptidoglycan-binding domain-containing protein [Desulfotignum sp.]
MNQIKQCLGLIVLTAFIFLEPPLMVTAQDSKHGGPKQESGFYYTIKKGDTLWDLSEKFYHSQWDWPGLWKINKEIKNPHQIYPGRKIRVFLKSSPSRLPAVPESAAAPKAFEDETRSTPAITPDFVYAKIDYAGFIKKKTVPVLGKIIREQDGNLMMSPGDIIYIKPSEPDALVPDQRYQVFTTQTVNEKINKERFKGIKHIIKAQIRVLETKTDYVSAVITHGVKQAHAGDLIMAYYDREPFLKVQEDPPPIDGAIICSQENALMVNDYAIAFINRGSDQNIRPGQIYSVLQENRSAFDASEGFWHAFTRDDIALDPLISGRLIVLHTEAAASTVMILSSRRDIHPGDMVH